MLIVHPSNVTRLRSHPQAHLEAFIIQRWVFSCPGCKRDWYLASALAQPDGSLMCPDCRSDADLVWCPGCQRSLPAAAFRGYPALDRLCADCRHAEPAFRSCARCGVPFTARRSDARYCSTRCRVAAHRAADASATRKEAR